MFFFRFQVPGREVMRTPLSNAEGERLGLRNFENMFMR